MIPTVAQCFRLMDEYRMLDNIRDHSIIVARIANLLGEELNRAGHRLELQLVVASALLHDIGKTACLDNDRDHAAYGREICLRHGMTELAPIVGGHVRFQDNPAGGFAEYDIVFYADKRVTHDQVVNLDEREAYILERYGRNDLHWLEVIREHCRSWRVVEGRIFSQLEFSPAKLAGLIDPDPATCDFGGSGAAGPDRAAMAF